MRLIDADALIESAFDRYCKDCNKRKGVKNGKWRVIYSVGDAPCRACEVDDMKAELEDAPSVDAAPVVHGRWIDLRQEGDSRFMCSVCKWKEDVPTCMGKPTVWEYCPSCGARMDGDENG